MEKMKQKLSIPRQELNMLKKPLWGFQIGIQIDDRGIVRQLQTIGVHHAAVCGIGILFKSNIVNRHSML